MAYSSAQSGASNPVGVDVIGGVDYELIKLLDATPGSTNGLVIDADGSARVAADRVAAGAVTAVASAATVVNLAAANAARRGLFIYNASTSDLYMKLGTGADIAAPSYTARLPPSAFWEMPTRPIYTGVVTGIWSAANGNALVTEL